MSNHTECHCVNRGSLLRDHNDNSMSLRGKRSGQHSHQRHFNTQQSGLHFTPPNPVQDINCRCPRHFQLFKEDFEREVHLPQPPFTLNWKCRCACAPNNPTCHRFASGEESFPLVDRKYIK